MKRFSFYLLFLFLISLLQSQTSTEELKTKIATQANDTIKVNLYNDLSASLYRSEPDSARYYAQKAIQLGKKLEYKKGLSLVLKGNKDAMVFTGIPSIKLLDNFNISEP